MPQELVAALHPLGNLALLVMAGCFVYLVRVVVNIQQILTMVCAKIDSHIAMDDLRFARVNQDIGKHDSQINDLRADRAAGLQTTIQALLRPDAAK